MKRLIVCCDGTWQKLTSSYPTNVVKIAQAIQPSANDGTSQIVFYDEGVGSGNAAEKFMAKGDKILGGAFGLGIDNNIQDAYRFLCLNYEPGDEIYLFGFSRGAYTVRSLAGLIRNSGGLLLRRNIREAPLAYDLYRDRSLTLREKEKFRRLPLPREYDPNIERIKACRAEAHKIYSDRSQLSLKDADQDTDAARQDLKRKEAKVREVLMKYSLTERNDADNRQAVKITLLGCWDTVGSLGVPKQIPFLNEWVNDKYEFHDTFLSSIIENAVHAVAIDEIRAVFDVTPMQRKSNDNQPLHQVWFPGGHGCVGGGSKADSGLSNAALVWMMDQMADLNLGLEFDRSKVEDGIHADSTIPFDNSLDGIYRLTGQIIRTIPPGQFFNIHKSAKERWSKRGDYRPKNLMIYAQELAGKTIA